jgi:adenylylsulfate kinase
MQNIELIDSAPARDRATHAKIERAPTVWFTGLPSAGKTTIAQLVRKRLSNSAFKVELLDGDAMRDNFSRDLGFSADDRNENLRRIAFIAELLARNGIIVLVAAVSPYREIRKKLREFLGCFVEVYVNAPLYVCEQRDTKGLYRKARAGHLKLLTGVDDPYEPPLAPEIECRTDLDSPEDCAETVADFLRARMPGHIHVLHR